MIALYPNKVYLQVIVFELESLTLNHHVWTHKILFLTDVTHSWASAYNSEALPFTYGQYVVIEVADKLYNSVTVCIFVLRESKYVFHICRKREPNAN